eukprot:TRINITY_DN273_c0_g2_i1.p1 TRINITY_DN273_c0_g2~~TRINITY_DN273_c0_g2_i1.p1  ORF type:complete len:556 (-),score=76.39 TRINITY_DN273_c0_g2_i1:116-1783(-)
MLKRVFLPGLLPYPKLHRFSRLSVSSLRANAFRAFTERPLSFSIVDSTLREGEQFSTAEFTHQDRVYIASILDRMGIEYIELMNPVVSEQALRDCKTISSMRLKKAKILTHTRCHMSDVKAAVESGVHGVNVYMATSPILAKHSHGKGIESVIETAKEVILYAKNSGLEVRFSCEDTFRSDMTDLLKIYSAVDKLGVNRVGLADTVGVATPDQVYETVKRVRDILSPETGIEFHTHNDTGCCIANAYMALIAGATHIDTCVLGIGERNGITPLGGFLARLYTLDKESIKSKYDLTYIKHLEKYVAQVVGLNIPFNNYITGSAAFTHKAGVHSKAVMAHPGAYEVLDPSDFGVERTIQYAHRLTGWNAMSQRSKQLGLNIPDELIKDVTVRIKNKADSKTITLDQVDSVLMRLAHASLSSSTIPKIPKDVIDKLPAEVKSAMQAAADAVSKYEASLVDEAVQQLEKEQIDHRPTVKLRFVGHLLDQRILNKLLDIIVDSKCEFKVISLEIPGSNELTSSCLLQLWSDTPNFLDNLKKKLEDLISKCEDSCSMVTID